MHFYFQMVLLCNQLIQWYEHQADLCRQERLAHYRPNGAHTNDREDL